MMTDILKKVINFLVFTIGGGLIATGIWYYYTERPSLSYNVNTYLFSAPQFDNENKITFLYKKNRFEKLYITLIDIVNDGGIALERNNYEDENNPLRIEGCQFFQYYIDNEKTYVSSKVDLIEEDSSLFVKFAYMNPKDVISIRILHTEKCDALVKGSMKGLSNIARQKTPQEYKKLYFKLFVTIILLLLIFLAFSVYCINKKMEKSMLLIYINNHFKSSKEKKKILNHLDQLTTFDEKINYLSSLK